MQPLLWAPGLNSTSAPSTVLWKTVLSECISSCHLGTFFFFFFATRTELSIGKAFFFFYEKLLQRANPYPCLMVLWEGDQDADVTEILWAFLNHRCIGVGIIFHWIFRVDLLVRTAAPTSLQHLGRFYPSSSLPSYTSLILLKWL